MSRAAMQQALEVLENDVMQRTYAGGVRISNAAIALRAALAEPEQEPVAWMMVNETHKLSPQLYWEPQQWHITWEAVPLYTAPTPRRPLTDEEMPTLFVGGLALNSKATTEIVRAVEKAHGIGEQHES